MNNVEVYAFIFWIASSVSAIVWLLWAFLPDSFIKDYLGLTYIPSKWWAVALPTYFLVVVFVANFIYIGMTLMKTQRLDSKYLISDESTPVYPDTVLGHDIPDAHDLPLHLVNKLMYD